VYKSGQTPDDVYYSPARPGHGEEYVRVPKRLDEERYQTYDDYTDAYRNDRFLRLGIRNRYMLNNFDYMDWYNIRYNNLYSYNSIWYDNWGFNNPWNSYYSWNNYYNPYCPYSGYNNYGNGGWRNGYAYRKPNNMRSYTFNSSSYKMNNQPRGSSYKSSTGNGRYNNSNRGSLGSALNKVFSNSGSSNGSRPATDTYTPSRTYSPSSSGSSSSGSSSSGNSGGNNSGSGVKRPGGGK
jgi:hypothetical protein